MNQHIFISYLFLFLWVCQLFFKWLKVMWNDFSTHFISIVWLFRKFNVEKSVGAWFLSIRNLLDYEKWTLRDFTEPTNLSQNTDSTSFCGVIWKVEQVLTFWWKTTIFLAIIYSKTNKQDSFDFMLALNKVQRGAC